MAQYFHLVSQENPNIQYVIRESETQPQALQGQQIVVSADQLMVIENQPQVIDATAGNAFQNAQFIVQESVPVYQNIRSQTQQPQVFFTTTESTPDQPVQVEQQMQQVGPPIVLNQQRSQIRTQTSTDLQKSLIPTLGRTTQVQLNKAGTVKHTTIPVVSLQQSSINQQSSTSLSTSSLPNQIQITLAAPNTLNQPTHQGLDGMDSNMRNGNSTSLGMFANRTKQTNSTTVSSTSLIDEIDPEETTTYDRGKAESLKGKHSARAAGMRGSRARRGIPRYNASTNFSQSKRQENTELQNQSHQKFMQQQKANSPQTHFMHHRQQLLQQAALRQQHQQQLQQQQQQQQQQLQQLQYVQPQYIIQPPSMHQKPPHSTLPPYVVSSQIQQIIEDTPVSEEFPDSIRMLVLLESGEQRLITFTLPKEVCTIQEILEQVGVPFQSDTRIECHETSYPGINYLVTVGAQPEQYEGQEENSVEASTSQPVEPGLSSTSEAIPSSPELLIEAETPRYVSGLVAICTHCGYSSENLDKCLRCKFKLPNEVKTAPAVHNENSDGIRDTKIAINLKNPDIAKLANAINKRLKPKPEPEPDILTLSSDDEEDYNDYNVNNFFETDQLLKRFNNSSVTLSAIRKEPTVNDLQQSMMFDKSYSAAVKGGGKEQSDSGIIVALIKCRTIRIGSYKYTPRFDVVIRPAEVVLKIPSLQDPLEFKTIVIERQHVAKVLVNFQKALPVLFYYVVPAFGEFIRSELGMEAGSDIYFDPLSKEEAYKRITILPEIVNEDAKIALKEIYGKTPNSVMDELTTKEANDILVKTCPKEISKFVEATKNTRCFSPEVRQLLIYPPGKGGLPINTEDYMCLAQDQFLNDVIIDFYLKYLVLQLPQEEQAKIHVFSTFFYKRLTTKPVKASRRSHPAELDPNLTPAQRRHARVEKWTKNVNLFDKDFVVVPINENCHWYLAIICYPALDGCYTMDGRPIKINEKQKAHKVVSIGGVTITNIKKERSQSIVCDEEEFSDKDEAEGDESELDSDASEESDNPDNIQLETSDTNTPIKQPCILIFDSLAGASRARVVATLRDYLTCEYKAKLGLDKVFNKDVIKGNCPKVPQQTNFTDCGLYLLQYVEHFITHPIQNYQIPIKSLKNWFDEHTVTRKREDIAILIKDLMVQYNFDTSCVPMLTLPTLNGKSIDNFQDDEDELMNDYEEEDEEEEELEDEATSDNLNTSLETHQDMGAHSDLEMSYDTSPNNSIVKEDLLSDAAFIPAQSSAQRDGDFLEETIINESEFKPDISELQKQTNRDTLCYLKAKRIIKHKSSEILDVKKFKTSFD